MNSQPSYRRRREVVTALSLSFVVGGGIFLFSLLIGGRLFLAMLATAAGLVAFGAVHYLLWGRRMEKETDRQDGHPRPLSTRDGAPRSSAGEGY